MATRQWRSQAQRGSSAANDHDAACLVMLRFPCNRIQPHNTNRITNASRNAMIEQHRSRSPTKDGKTTTFITHPERGGPFPVIIFYMDAPAIREELRDMARRLGTSGYYVMLPNMYYRAGVMELGPINPTRIAGAQAHVRADGLAQHPAGHGRHRGPARLRRHPEGRQHQDHRHRRLLHERPLRGERGDAFPRSGQGAPPRSTAPIWRPTSPTARIWPRRRPRPSSISPAPRPTSTRRWRSSRKVEGRHEGVEQRGRDLSRHPSRLCLPQAPGLSTATPPNGTGSGYVALYRRNLSAKPEPPDAMPFLLIDFPVFNPDRASRSGRS